MKTFIKTCTVAAMVIVFFGCEPEEDTVPLVVNQSFTESELMDLIDQSDFTDPNGRHRSAKISFNPVLEPFKNVGEVGKSLLIRKNGKGLAMVLKTNVEANHAFTGWWIIFNNTKKCVDTPCGSGGFADFINGAETGLAMLYATGNVSRRNGVTVLVARLKEGEMPEGVNGKLLMQPERVLNPGNAEDAHVSLIIRSHGPKIPGQVRNQISSHGGGCTADFDPFSMIPMNEGECADIQIAFHQP